MPGRLSNSVSMLQGTRESLKRKKKTQDELIGICQPDTNLDLSKKRKSLVVVFICIFFIHPILFKVFHF